MSGQRKFYQKCICGSEIEIGESYEFISGSETRQLFETWQQQHADCLPLFHQIQRRRLFTISQKLAIAEVKNDKL